jgi:hypothetical protein
VAAALLAAGVALTASADGADPECPSRETLRGDRGTWTVLPAPTFPTGEQVMTDHTVDRYEPTAHFATNGAVVMRSLDDACSWKEVYRLPDQPSLQMPVTAQTGRIEHLQAARTVIFASVSAPGAALPEELPKADIATVLVHSTDGGEAWKVPETLPVLPGAPGPIAFNDVEGVVFAAAGGLVYRSGDDGASFVPTTPLGEVSEIESLVANVTHITGGGMLWAKAVDGPAFHSQNEGTSWSRHEPAEIGTHGPVLQPVEKGDESRVAFFDSEANTGKLSDFIYSTDRGQTFTRYGAQAVAGLEGSTTSYDGEQRRGDIVLTTTDGVYRYHPRFKRMVSIDEFALGPMTGATASHTFEARVHYRFHSDKEIFVYEENEGGAAELPIPGVFDHTEKEPAPPVLAPSGGEVEVPAGKSRDVTYRLSLAARSTKLDTFFVLDTSNSTQGYIHGLRIGISKIARGLASAGVEARYGLGQYQDNGASRGIRYARSAGIGGADTLRTALTKLDTNGGEEPGYTAVHQAMTGSGVLTPSQGPPVPAGQAADWRPRTVRTLVLVADESFAFDPDGADRITAGLALKDEKVRFVGVVVRDEDFDPRLPGVDCAAVLAEPTKSVDGTEGDHRLRCQLEDLARAAETFAPATGTDCNGDGKIDVAPGAPLVCTVDSADSAGIVKVADPLRRLLLAVTDEQPVALRAGGDGEEMVKVTPAGDFSKLDLKKEHALDFTVRYHCGRDDAGEKFPLKLDALVAGNEVASSAPTLVCGAVPAVVAKKARAKKKKSKPKPEPVPVQPVPAAAPPPVPAPPAPAPATVPIAISPPATVPPPALASAPAPAPASASSPMVAVADRPQTESAATLVHVNEDDGIEPAELQFTRTGGVVALLGGLLLFWPADSRRRSPAPALSTERDVSLSRRRRRSR